MQMLAEPAINQYQEQSRISGVVRLEENAQEPDGAGSETSRLTLRLGRAGMNTVVLAEEGNTSRWTIEAAPPDRRRVGTVEQREDGFYVSPEGPAADLIAGLRPGPYRDLYEAMDAIAFATGGACEKAQS